MYNLSRLSPVELHSNFGHRMSVFSDEPYSKQAKLHMVSVVSLDSWNPVTGPLDVQVRSCRVDPM